MRVTPWVAVLCTVVYWAAGDEPAPDDALEGAAASLVKDTVATMLKNDVSLRRQASELRRCKDELAHRLTSNATPDASGGLQRLLAPMGPQASKLNPAPKKA